MTDRTTTPPWLVSMITDAASEHVGTYDRITVTRSGDGVVEYGPSDHPGRCHWGGYARTSMSFYKGEDSWIILAPQIICHHPAATVAVAEALTDPAVSRFMQLWR